MLLPYFAYYSGIKHYLNADKIIIKETTSHGRENENDSTI